jgi:hypothetical protein
MSRLTEYWESYDRFYDDFEKEGMNLEDLLLKSKFNFHQGKLTFSSKSKFNIGSKVSANHEVGLKHKCSKISIDFKSKTGGENTLEIEGDSYKKEHITVAGYVKSVNNLSENKNSGDTKASVRIHHKDNLLLTLGVENWKCCNGGPKDFVIGGSFGKRVEEVKLTFNTLFNFNIDTKFLKLARFFVKGNKGDLTGLFLVNANRSESGEGEKKVTTQAFDLALKFTKQVCPKTKVGGSLSHNIDDQKTEVALVGSHQFDRLRLNAKVSTERDLTLGVTSVQDDITFSFAAKSSLGSASEDSGETKKSKYWVNYKFGASVEFNRV